ncbi:hypothetical protein LAZ67_2003329 [Cordylochernes scorpioides]|uniref:Retroviral polymerase SH3-like domain-containing protein n=1 Tax=Cordylochernes scorpioides TaxID=51811 RepID=A0ABY6K7D1_9ARAC|nr:hypothetical protein LAZ67_2003329 [Cordylochernes scorpioides]
MDDNIQDHGRPTSENRRAYDPSQDVAKKDMRHSVLSVFQMIENGRKVVFNKSGCHIMDMKDQNDRVSLASECKEELTLELWHKRLMHVNAYTIAKMAKNQSNGVAERMNRTLLDLVRSTISGSGLPKASWAELTYTAAYVRNRVLNNHNGESTPYELGRGYRVWIPEMKKVVESRDCVFKESNVSRNDSNREVLPSVEHYSYGTQREIEENPVSLLDQEDVIPTEEDSHNEDTVKPSPTRSHPMILRNQRNAENSIELLSTEEIGGEGFDDFGEHDIEELLVDEALNDDDILESMVDTTKDFETVDSELEDVTPLDEKLLREGLQLSGKLEIFFIQNDNDVERALKFQRDLKFCMSGYRELYKELVKPSQRLITDYLVKEKKNH